MIRIFQHHSNKSYFLFKISGLLDPNDVQELNNHFSQIESTKHNSITTFVEIEKGAQLINLEFLTEMKQLIPKYKRYIKQRVIFGLTGIQHILFKNYTMLIGVSNEYLILKTKQDCEEMFAISFEKEFTKVSKGIK